MMASLSFLSVLVMLALMLTICAPLLLIWLFIRDYQKGDLW